MGWERGEEDGQKRLKHKNPQQTRLSIGYFVLPCFYDVNLLHIPKASVPLDHTHDLEGRWGGGIHGAWSYYIPHLG